MRVPVLGIFSLLSIAIVIGCTSQTLSKDSSLSPGTHSRELQSEGRRWSYKVHVPSQYRPGKPIPLVLILHGAGGDGELYLEATGWRRKANEAGFIAVAPDGLPSRPLLPAEHLLNPRVWNAGNLRPNTNRVKINDVAFFKALLNQVKRDYSIDNGRIYLTGHSNGGGMVFVLATELSDFTAIAPVMALYWRNNANIISPVSTLYMIGTKDPVIPLNGGESKLSIWGNRRTPPVMDTVNLWANASGCPSRAMTIDTQRNVKILRFEPCNNKTEFLVYFIQGQGHNWPGGKTKLKESIIGPNINTINATDVIWNFFRKQVR